MNFLGDPGYLIEMAVLLLVGLGVLVRRAMSGPHHVSHRKLHRLQAGLSRLERGSATHPRGEPQPAFGTHRSDAGPQPRAVTETDEHLTHGLLPSDGLGPQHRATTAHPGDEQPFPDGGGSAQQSTGVGAPDPPPVDVPAGSAA